MKTLKGENEMSFKEFDMTEYFNVLEAFKTEYQDKVIKTYCSIDKYNTRIEKMKACEAKLAKMIIEQYGSIKKYAEVVKKNLNNSLAITNMVLVHLSLLENPLGFMLKIIIP